MRLLLTSATSGFKIAYLFVFMLIGLFIATIISKLLFLIPIFDINNELVFIYITTITQSVFAIALPAVLIVAWTSSEPLEYLKIKRGKSFNKKILFAILVFIFSYIFASFLTIWNKGMT